MVNEAQLVVSSKDGMVYLSVPEPVCWVGLTPEEADKLITVLKTHVANARIQAATKEPQEVPSKGGLPS